MIVAIALAIQAASAAPGQNEGSPTPTPTLATLAVPPSPINPQTWVTPNDYPAEAMRSQQQGVVQFRLAIDTQGFVKDCAITSSSGSPVLDDKACSLMRERGRFEPARDSNGNLVEATFVSRVRWQLPETGVPIEHSRWITHIVYPGQGAAPRCTLEAQIGDRKFVPPAVCPAWIAQTGAEEGNKPRRVLMIVEQRRIDEPAFPPIAEQSRYRTTRDVVDRFSVDATGTASDCRRTKGALDGSESQSCNPLFHYLNRAGTTLQVEKWNFGGILAVSGSKSRSHSR